VPPTKHVVASWRHRGMEFAAEGAGKVAVTIDGDNAAAPGPMEMLLLSLAACTGADMIIILKKKRLDLKELVIEADGVRREEEPQRYLSIVLRYRVSATGATESAVRQAIDLSIEKYCSVRHSLAPDISITYELALQA